MHPLQRSRSKENPSCTDIITVITSYSIHYTKLYDTGQLYKQFAVTICTAVVISAINALTLSPALCAVLLREPKVIRRGPLFWFNRALEVSRNVYVASTAWLIRRLFVALVIFV